MLECDFLNVDIVSRPHDVSLRQPAAAGQCYSPSPSPATSPEPRTSSSASGSEGASPEVLRQLCGDHYDVVVFSLLLSYLPCTTQRLTCCVNAHRVLRLHGVLLVISPDSSHQNRHAALMVGWKHCIEAVGFHRLNVVLARAGMHQIVCVLMS